jgi:flavin reductase (DIM6/NTAB) family NADH-FMN oxidoreductase RutF
MASWTTGVAVMAARAGGLAHGVTVSSFTSLSLDPPLVLVCLHEHSSLLQLVDVARRFSVSVLAHHQKPISSRFALPGREPAARNDELEDVSAGGQPVVRDAVAWLACDLHAKFIQGDHVIVVGRVTGAHAHGERSPLLYHRRGYHALGERQ